MLHFSDITKIQLLSKKQMYEQWHSCGRLLIYFIFAESAPDPEVPEVPEVSEDLEGSEGSEVTEVLEDPEVLEVPEDLEVTKYQLPSETETSLEASFQVAESQPDLQ